MTPVVLGVWASLLSISVSSNDMSIVQEYSLKGVLSLVLLHGEVGVVVAFKSLSPIDRFAMWAGVFAVISRKDGL